MSKMKKILSLIILLGVTCTVMAQETGSPVVDKEKGDWGEIFNVVTTQEYTFIDMKKSSHGRISTETYLKYINPSNGLTETIKLAKTDVTTGWPFDHHMYFTLYFPPLPEGVDVFDMIEPKGTRLYGVHIFPVKYETPKEENLVRRFVAEEIKTLIDSSNFAFSGHYESMDKAGGYRLAVLQSTDTVYVVYVGHDNGDVGTWKYGEVKAILRATAIPNAYKAEWYMRDKTVKPVFITFDAISMIVSFDENTDNVFVKMGSPNAVPNGMGVQSEQWSGTGFAIGDGYIVTNNHVVGEAKNMIVKGIEGDINAGFAAEVVATDKLNDIAIIRINDPDFKGFGVLPYAVQQQMANVGEEVFVLGYPLTQALGDEVKLTSGIISSRTGYKGDISTYQISAPVQPGNSGGPMFDNKGNVIGIVVANVPGG